MLRQCIKSIFPKGKGKKKVYVIVGHGKIRWCLSAVILDQGFKMVKVEAMSVLSEFYFERPICPSRPPLPSSCSALYTQQICLSCPKLQELANVCDSLWVTT